MAKRKQPKTNNSASFLGARAALAARQGQQFGGDRDLNTVLGYKTALTGNDYLAMYQRGDIAQPIVDAYPAACWRAAPMVYEGHSEDETPFEKSLNELAERTKMWHYVARADRNAGLGRYALLVIGLDDNQAPSVPAAPRAGQRVLWWLPVPEANCSIVRWTTDPQNENYGRPELYRVTVGAEESNGQGQRTAEYHYTRCVHIAENCIQDDTFGNPRLQSVFNRVYDLQKIVGGSGEMFWLTARQGLVFQASEGATIGAEAGESLKTEALEYQHQLRRLLTAQNGEWKTLQAQVSDPRGPVDAVLDMIAAAVRIPKRILLGNEAGELASSQDETAWLARVDERRNTFVKPMILDRLLSRLIHLGVIKPPKVPGVYVVEWPLAAVSAAAAATIGLTKAQTLAAYAGNAAAAMIVPPEEFRETFLGLQPEPAGGFDDPDESAEDNAERSDANPDDKARFRG